VLFPQPMILSGTFPFEVIQSPENSLRQSDGLLGLIGRAGRGDEIAVEQLQEPPHWGPTLGTPTSDPNVFLEVLIAAALRGARVRILMDSYFDEGDNAATVAYIESLRAASPTLRADLQARLGNPTALGIHNKMLLASIAGRGYAHIGSLNHGELAAKGNRELAVQVESQGLYAELARVFQADWQLSAPIFLPMVARDYTPPDHIVISEILYDPSGNPDTGKEWIELHNPTARVMDISGWSLGDATADGEFGAGRYLFPTGTMLQPLGVIVIAQQAADVTFRPNFEFLTDPNRDDLTVPNMLPAAAWDGFGLALSNTGDHVILRDAAGQVVDVVVWGGSSYPGTLPHPGVIMSDHSLERRPAYQDTNDCAADFVDRTPPTPGTVP
jgi:hypothetical protein